MENVARIISANRPPVALIERRNDCATAGGPLRFDDNIITRTAAAAVRAAPPALPAVICLACAQHLHG